MTRRILAILADEHGGSDVGLLNPDTILERDDDGKITRYKPQLSPYQECLWSWYINHLNTVSDFANGDEIIVLHNGDLTRGNKFSENWVSCRVSDQIAIAYYNLKPWLDLPNVRVVRLSKGTGVHVFGEGSSEIVVSKMLELAYSDKDIAVVYHGLLDLDGYTVDYAHHGPPPGIRDWIRGNVARLYLQDRMMRMLKRGERPPDIFLTAHYHQYVRVVHVLEWEGRDYMSSLIISPSYCGPEDHTIKVSRSTDVITNGLVMLEIVDGKLNLIQPLLETIDLRVKETI